MRRIETIIVHCSDSPEGRADTINDVRRWHVDERGFTDIGYHYVVHLDGSIHPGRRLNSTGAHCAGHNLTSIGICYIGGKTRNLKQAKDTRTDAQKIALESLIRCLKAEFPDAKVHGHRDFANKDCPCFDAKEEYKSL